MIRTGKILKIIASVAGMCVLGFILCMVVGVVLGKPSKGERISRSHGIPHHLVIAHRGASYLAPEETRPAYVLARDMGAHYLEMDIQRTKDGTLVAFHDDILDRTTNVASVFPGREKDPVHRFTIDELKQLDAGTWFNMLYPERAKKMFEGLKILTLDEVVDIAEEAENRPGLYIETKSAQQFPGIEKDIVDLLERRGWLEEGHPSIRKENDHPQEQPSNLVTVGTGEARIIFQSFDLGSLIKLKDLAPGVPRIYLVSQDMEKEQGWDNIIRDARETCAGLGPVGYLGWPWHVGEAHRNGLLIHLYTINSPWQYWFFSKFGVDGFFTDRCDRLMSFYDMMLYKTPDVILESISGNSP